MDLGMVSLSPYAPPCSFESGCSIHGDGAAVQSLLHHSAINVRGATLVPTTWQLKSVGPWAGLSTYQLLL